jgi:hypothetical protein
MEKYLGIAVRPGSSEGLIARKRSILLVFPSYDKSGQPREEIAELEEVVACVTFCPDVRR